MRCRYKALRNMYRYLLVLVLVLQAFSPLACTVISSRQAQHATVSCCSEKQLPFQTPHGIPPQQCCFKTGPLLGKATVPDAIELPQLVFTMHSLFTPATLCYQAHTPAIADWLASASPPSLAVLSFFRI
jgi:hypothetical protein